MAAYFLCFFNTITWNLSKSDKAALFCLMAAFWADGVAAYLASMSAAAHFLLTVPVLEPLGNFGNTIGVKASLAKAIACLLMEGPSIKTCRLVYVFI